MQEKEKSIPSISYVLRTISDDKTLMLLKNVTMVDGKGHIPLKELNLTTKQYYSRISGLMAAGIIKRNRGKYSITAFGKILCDVQMTIEKTLQYYWKLKAIESIQTSDISEHDYLKLVDTLIDNYQLKDIFMKSPNLLKQEFTEHSSPR